MAWASISDDFPRHPKVVAAGLDGQALFVAALVYANVYRTDGFIPRAVMGTLSPLVRTPSRTTSRLVLVGLLEEVDGGYLIHDFGAHNLTSEERENRAKSAKVRKDAWKAKNVGTRSERVPNATGTESLSLALAPREKKEALSAKADPPAADQGQIQRESSPSSSSPVSAQALMDAWNEHRGELPPWSRMTDKRRIAATARLRDRAIDGPDGFIEVIQRMAASAFCCGKNDRGWRADPDFLLQPDAAVKVLEGKYDGVAPLKATGVYGVDIPPLVKHDSDTDPDDPRWR